MKKIVVFLNNPGQQGVWERGKECVQQVEMSKAKCQVRFVIRVSAIIKGKVYGGKISDLV